MCSIAVNIPEAVLYDTRMGQEEAGEYVAPRTPIRGTI